MPFGYNGKILHVDLVNQSWQVEEPDESFYQQYVGGSALGLYYLLKEMPPGVDPLSPENILVFSLSGLTGAPISGQSRLMVNAKSPLTGAIGDSQSGGFFPAEMKFAGFDAIVLRGRASEPVYLWIRDGVVEIRPARHLWGEMTGETEQIIRTELGDPKIQIAQIGPAGEKLVRLAAIMNMSNRANGRTGMGAVMGSKNLKAIAVRGSKGPQSIPFADKSAIIRMAQSGSKDIVHRPDMQTLAVYGTAGSVAGLNFMGSFPSHNYDSGVFDRWEKISGETMYDTILRGAADGRQNSLGRDTCYACAVRCKRVVETEYRGSKIEPRYGGPEYETIAAFGSYCDVDDLAAIALANQLCNQYGADTISLGATIAFAMDCYERGILTAQETDHLDLHFGNAEAMISLTEQILTRSSLLGDWLAEGSARAAKIFGHGAEELLITVKGQEISAHTPQAKRSLGLVYAVNPFGADHQSSSHDPVYEMGTTDEMYLSRLAQIGLHLPQPPRSLGREKIRFALLTEYFYSALDTFGLCQFVFGPAWSLYGPDQTIELIHAALGWDYTIREFLHLGEVRLNLLRAFNAREGIGRREDRLPKKMFKALKGGAADGMQLSEEEIENAKDIYYELAGWDVKEGIPTREKLIQLGLGWVAKTPD